MHNSLNSTNDEQNIVLNVDIDESDSIQFDLLHIDECGSPVYTSRSYHIDSGHGYIGLFELFDDIFSKRIRFSYSCRTVQKLLLSLDDAEQVFLKDSGRSFFEYYSAIHNTVVHTVNTQSQFSNPMLEPLSGGYGIERESSDIRKFKINAITSFGGCDKIINNIIHNFRNNGHTEVGNFVCLDMMSIDKPSFFIETTVNMPLLFHYFDFAVSYMENLIIPYVKGGIYGEGIIPKVRICNLSNDMTLEHLLSMCDDDGYVIDLDKCDIFENPFTEIEFTKEYCEGKRLSSIIGH